MARISVVEGDITRLHELGLRPDAIVNAANEALAAGSGVCGAIFAAAGRHELTAACDAIGGCPTGSAVATPGFELSAHGVDHIIHAVGPRFPRGGEPSELDLADSLLASAYRSTLRVADELGTVQRLALPALSTGIYGFPEERAARIATGVLSRYDGPLLELYLVAFGARSAQILGDALATSQGAAPAEGSRRPAEATSACQSCGSPTARRWDTPDGPAHLCPACATLHGLGCP